MSAPNALTFSGSAPGWAALGLVAGLAVAVVLGPALAPRAARRRRPTPDRTIGVGGTGRSRRCGTTPPARRSRRPAAEGQDARAAAAVAMQGVVKALRAAGVAERDIQTTTLSLQPIYDYKSSGSSPKITGYAAERCRRHGARPRQARGCSRRRACRRDTTLDGITFQVVSPTGAEAQARTQAMRDARAKADALAAAAGVSIVGVASISEQSSPSPWPMPYAGAARADEAATPILPGTSEITVTVSVVYLIG